MSEIKDAVREDHERLARWLESQATGALRKEPVCFEDRERWAKWAREAAALLRNSVRSRTPRKRSPTKAKSKKRSVR